MRLTVLGCWSAAVPGPGGRASGYLVEHGDAAILLDCGNGVLGELARHLPLDRLGAVFLSHLHNDHVADLYPLALWAKFTKRKLPVYGPEGTRTLLYRWFSLFTGDPDSYVEALKLTEYRAWQAYDAAGLAVTPCPVEHNIPAHAFRVEAGGRLLVYSGDTKESALLEEAAKGADILLAEATYAGEAPPAHSIDRHMTGRQAGALAKRAGARRLLVTHFLTGTDPATVAREAADAFGGAVEAVREGMRIEVGGA